MKQVLLIAASIFILACTTDAQKLFGTTSLNGTGGGAIVAYDEATHIFDAAATFPIAGASPPAGLVQAIDGKLYGMALGENGGNGIIYTYDPVTSTYNTVKAFLGSDGSYPAGTLVQGSDGKLYGLTPEGGTNNAGVIFSFDPSAAVYTKLYDFSGDYTMGNSPGGTLVQAPNGKLYGIAGGGNNHYSAIFSFDPSTLVYSKLYDFDYNSGFPFPNLTLASDGKLYGVTSSGGINYEGTIFSFDPNTAAYTKLYDIAGGYPQGPPFTPLMEASDGKLYGIRGYNNTIYSFDPVSLVYSDVYSYTYADGVPSGSLIQAADGKLYDITHGGGNNGGGVIFSFDPVNDVYTKLKDLASDSDGVYSAGGLIQASDGKLYGTTQYGGVRNEGVVFSFAPQTADYEVIKAFGYGDPGYGLSGGLVFGSDGNLYGMTTYGGTYNDGTIFSFNPLTSVVTDVADFNGTNGANPNRSLFAGADGKFYGTTPLGGTGNTPRGVFFSFDPASGSITVLKNFDADNFGAAFPQAGVIQASDGKLYGSCQSGGGIQQGGILYSWDTAYHAFAQVHAFEYPFDDYSNNNGPEGALLQNTDGKLYGTDKNGYQNWGAIFSFDIHSLAYTTLHVFNTAKEGGPNGDLTKGADGKLYGLTSGDIYNPGGVLFSYDVAASTYATLVHFDTNTGNTPHGGLTLASDGKMYGMTQLGGANNEGTVFSYDPSTATFTKLADLNGINGAQPLYSSFVEANCNTVYYRDFDKDGYGDANNSVHACSKITGYVTNNTDCNDSDATIYPGAPELCDGKDNNCNGRVDENCPVLKMTINDVALAERNTKTRLMNFSVTLNKIAYKQITVNFATQDATATSPSDYIATSGTITFAPGIKKQLIHVTINGDRVVEPDETFRVKLSNAANAVITDSIGIGTIINDDGVSSAAMATAINQRSISISPVPAINTVTIRLNGFIGDITLQLATLQGSILKQEKLQAGISKTAEKEINVSDIAAGIYFITAIDEDGNRETEKLVVIH